ncbi:MAG: RNA 2',3'-cyclic phosphodiesterase [Vicinamibacterales bacterium]
MRLFVGVGISERMRQAAAEAAERIRRRLVRAIDARWVDPRDMHLTVRFIGHVDDDRVPMLLTRLVAPVQVPPFDIALERCGVFPASGTVRVIWIGLRSGLPSLAEMHHEFNRRLAAAGFKAEDRPYSPHLTLARVKRVSGRPAAIREKLDGVPVPPAPSRIDRAVIFRSHLSQHGARYEALASVPLA